MDGREVREDLRRYFAGCPFPVHAAYLFGSYARGHATPESDVDVAVWLQEPKEEGRAALCRAILSDLSRILADAPVDICSLADETRSDAALYEMQTCLEAVSDIATHLAVGAGLGRPGSRADAVHLLVRHRILPEELEPRLAAALGMRNVLIHGYLRLILRMVYDAI